MYRNCFGLLILVIFIIGCKPSVNVPVTGGKIKLKLVSAKKQDTFRSPGSSTLTPNSESDECLILLGEFNADSIETKSVESWPAVIVDENGRISHYSFRSMTRYSNSHRHTVEWVYITDRSSKSLRLILAGEKSVSLNSILK